LRLQPTILGQQTTATISRWIAYAAKVINGKISYGSTMANTDEDKNIDVWKAHGTTPGTANVAFTINHSLGRVPITIVGQDGNNGGVLYRGGTWTTTAVILKCTTASMAYNVVLA
jgi:hypothetical protein